MNRRRRHQRLGRPGARAFSRRHRDPRASLAEERGLLGALILDPSMIQTMAALRPPGWFTDDRCLAVMRALFCIRWMSRLSVDDVAEALERHGALDYVGGRAAVEALIEPAVHLTRAQAEVEAARLPIHREPLVAYAARLLDALPAS